MMIELMEFFVGYSDNPITTIVLYTGATVVSILMIIGIIDVFYTIGRVFR